jgi:hypothetical protein
MLSSLEVIIADAGFGPKECVLSNEPNPLSRLHAMS